MVPVSTFGCHVGTRSHRTSYHVSHTAGSSFACTGVMTSKGSFKADVVVLAAGCGIPTLAEQLWLLVPLIARPSTVVVITKPLKPLLTHMIVTGIFNKHSHDGPPKTC